MVQLLLALSSLGDTATAYRENVKEMTQAVQLAFNGVHQEQESVDEFTLAAAHCGIESACRLESNQTGLADQYDGHMAPMEQPPELVLTGGRPAEDDDLVTDCNAKLVRYKKSCPFS